MRPVAMDTMSPRSIARRSPATSASSRSGGRSSKAPSRSQTRPPQPARKEPPPPPPLSRRRARERSTYVPQNGSLTSWSGRSPPPGSRGRQPRSIGNRMMKQRTRSANRRRPRMALVPVWAYRERAEEVAILLGQLEARGRPRPAPLREEDPGLGAALEDLGDGVARGLRGLERDQDGPHELAHQAGHMRVGRHAPY